MYRFINFIYENSDNIEDNIVDNKYDFTEDTNENLHTLELSKLRKTRNVQNQNFRKTSVKPEFGNEKAGYVFL